MENQNYTAWFKANNNSTFGRYDGYVSKKEAIKAAKEMCLGNVFGGNSGVWGVDNSEGFGVASGNVNA